MKNLATLSYFRILEACAQPGCPICLLLEESVNKYLDALLYEMVTDSGTHEALRRSLGFCNEHAWRLPQVSASAALGIAIIYRSLVDQVSVELGATCYQQSRRSLWHKAREVLGRLAPAAIEAAVRRLHPRDRCPACVHRSAMETIALTAMVSALPDDQQLQAALHSSDGLCLPHLRRALALAREEAGFAALRMLAVDKLAGLQRDLDEFIRKNDYRFNAEGFGAEADSWRRAIGWLVGRKGARCD